ncbi:MAG: hypothetical protein ACFCUW_06050 [Kiloniellaceae bacterium]
MFSKLTKIASTAAVAATFVLVAAATPADAKDWRHSMDRHYDAAEQNRYVPKGDNPQWGFTLDTVVADMEWRQRTSHMLRHLPKPSTEPAARRSNQLADRPATSSLRFAF